MTEPPVSEGSSESEPLLLPKVRAAKQLVDGARWALLDAVIELNDVESEVLRAGRARLDEVMQELDVLGPGASLSEATAEEYQPGDGPGQPEDDCQ